MLRTLKAKLKSFLILYPQDVTTTIQSSTADLLDFVSAVINVAVGSFNFSSGNKIGVKLQESDDDSSYSDVADADYLDALSATPQFYEFKAAADSETMKSIHYRGAKRYVQVALTVTGTVNVACSATAVQGHPQLQPPL